MKRSNIYLSMVALVMASALSIPAAAQSVKMMFSGTGANSTVDLKQPNLSSPFEYNLTGTGALGPFTVRLVSAGPQSPSSSNTCSGPNKLYFQVTAGGGVLRFQDGSLLYVRLTDGSDCIDFAAFDALCIRVLQITGGTGRFKNASGSITLTETLVPVLVDVTGNPVLAAATGEITGTVYGVSEGQASGGGQ